MAEGDAQEERKTLPAGEIQQANPPPPQEDDALREAAQIGGGRPIRDLKKEAEERDHERGENFRDSFEKLAIWTMYAIFGSMALLGIVWLIHTVFPEKCSAAVNVFGLQLCRWLIPEQVIIIQDILTGGIIAGLIAEHIKRRMGH